MFKRVVATTLILTLLVAGFVVLETRRKEPTQVVALLMRYYNTSTGTFNDVSGDIRYTGPESVGYEDKGDGNVVVHFGDLQFELVSADYKNEQLMAAMKQLGMEIKVNKKTGDATLYYLGQKTQTFGKFKAGK